MTPSIFIGPRMLLNDCNHSATAMFGGQQYCCKEAHNLGAGLPAKPPALTGSSARPSLCKKAT